MTEVKKSKYADLIAVYCCNNALDIPSALEASRFFDSLPKETVITMINTLKQEIGTNTEKSQRIKASGIFARFRETASQIV